MTGAIPSRIPGGEGGVSPVEANLLTTTLLLALVGGKQYPALLAGVAAGRWAACLAETAKSAGVTIEMYATAGATPEDPRGAILPLITDDASAPRVALLVVDGPRDHAAVSRFFLDLEPRVVSGGFVAFAEYDSLDSPDITDFVNELIDAGQYRKIQVVGGLAVLQKLGDPDSGVADASGEELNGAMGPRPFPDALLNAMAINLREMVQRTAWIERRSQLVDANRLEVIRELRTALEERTAWAERMVAEAEARGAVIDELREALNERTAWAERMVAEAEARGAVIEELQRALDALNKARGPE
jgi:hypothetical protein